ncbi:MAG: transposase zinc-binding domain-containing protein [Magnetococcales bacterium]|nr:transposase zinc-binding domain-containing protein [Magnetococcales bacterium]
MATTTNATPATNQSSVTTPAKNRHCPKCHTQQTRQWLENRCEELLPAPYFHVTITIPEALRPLFHANRLDLYHLFMLTCAEAIIGGSPLKSASR